MKKIYSTVIVSLLVATAAQAQLTISNGNHVMEISGSASTYYNQRILKEGEYDHSKDRFKLRDAQLSIEGRVSNIWEYKLQADLADMSANTSSGEIDPENPGLMDASVTYKGLGFLDIKAGYGKVPYSLSSMVPFTFSPYWQRAELTRGSLFSRRDAGVTLHSSLWRQRVNLYAGVYSGLGEMALIGDNDASGNPEFIGRAEFSYPARYRYRLIDDRHSPIPMFMIGVNGRYMNKTLPDGEVFPANTQSEYGMKVIDGKKYVYGFDVSFMYQGFSAQFEMHQIKGEPAKTNDPLFMGYTPQQTHGYFLAGGYIAEVNYHIAPINTIVSARYEELDLNDLAKGNSQRFSPAVAYQIKGFDAMVKFQYFNILKEETTYDALKWKEQYRLGIQFNFN
ncbi:porin [Flavobacterium sp. RHBU_3]|uniref:porin n=1 Tax=Flavobacterium sp. RHBU_3 TaxID=3391184 RepID=UPI0039850C5F